MSVSTDHRPRRTPALLRLLDSLWDTSVTGHPEYQDAYKWSCHVLTSEVDEPTTSAHRLELERGLAKNDGYEQNNRI